MILHNHSQLSHSQFLDTLIASFCTVLAYVHLQLNFCRSRCIAYRQMVSHQCVNVVLHSIGLDASVATTLTCIWFFSSICEHVLRAYGCDGIDLFCPNVFFGGFRARDPLISPYFQIKIKIYNHYSTLSHFH